MRIPVPPESLARHLLISHWRTMTHDPIRKASEDREAPDGRRQTIDLRDCSTVTAAGLAASVEQTHEWTRWDWIKWAAFWFLFAGPALFVLLLVVVP